MLSHSKLIVITSHTIKLLISCNILSCSSKVIKILQSRIYSMLCVKEGYHKYKAYYVDRSIKYQKILSNYKTILC